MSRKGGGGGGGYFGLRLKYINLQEFKKKEKKEKKTPENNSWMSELCITIALAESINIICFGPHASGACIIGVNPSEALPECRVVWVCILEISTAVPGKHCKLSLVLAGS